MTLAPAGAARNTKNAAWAGIGSSTESETQHPTAALSRLMRIIMTLVGSLLAFSALASEYLGQLGENPYS